LIVKALEEPPHRRDGRAYRAVGVLGVPKDLLWYTPEEVETWSRAVNHIVATALREGRVVDVKPRTSCECAPTRFCIPRWMKFGRRLG
jgi:hypothetical protein